jgi:hypothetical protein
MAHAIVAAEVGDTAFRAQYFRLTRPYVGKPMIDARAITAGVNHEIGRNISLICPNSPDVLNLSSIRNKTDGSRAAKTLNAILVR